MLEKEGENHLEYPQKYAIMCKKNIYTYYMLHVKISKNLLVLPVSKTITGIKMQMADNSKSSQHQ